MWLAFVQFNPSRSYTFPDPGGEFGDKIIKAGDFVSEMKLHKLV